MATMILPVGRAEARPGAPKLIQEILGDITLSMSEKLLLLEGLFVHDSTPGPQVGGTGRGLA
jgi:hypothetical protein